MLNRLTYLFLIFLGLTSCVDIIDLELDDSEPRPVIEAYISNGEYASVSVTMSAAYNDVLDFLLVDAIVTLADSSGRSEVLQRNDSLSVYEGSLIQGIENETYSLSVEVDTSTFISSSHISSPIDVDSIFCEYNVQLSELMQASTEQLTEEEQEDVLDSIYNIYVYYNDPIGEDNYYLSRIMRNGELILDYTLSTDKDADGEQQTSVFFEGFLIQDTATVFIYSLDKNGYEYYQGLSDLGGTDIPYNPYTNIIGGTDVLGFFSARYTTKYQFYIRDEAVFIAP